MHELVELDMNARDKKANLVDAMEVALLLRSSRFPERVREMRYLCRQMHHHPVQEALVSWDGATLAAAPPPGTGGAGKAMAVCLSASRLCKSSSRSELVLVQWLSSNRPLNITCPLLVHQPTNQPTNQPACHANPFSTC